MCPGKKKKISPDDVEPAGFHLLSSPLTLHQKKNKLAPSRTVVKRWLSPYNELQTQFFKSDAASRKQHQLKLFPHVIKELASLCFFFTISGMSPLHPRFPVQPQPPYSRVETHGRCVTSWSPLGSRNSKQRCVMGDSIVESFCEGEEEEEEEEELWTVTGGLPETRTWVLERLSVGMRLIPWLKGVINKIAHVSQIPLVGQQATGFIPTLIHIPMCMKEVLFSFHCQEEVETPKGTPRQIYCETHRLGSLHKETAEHLDPTEAEKQTDAGDKLMPTPLLTPLQAHLLVLPLAGELETLEEQVLCVLVQLHVQVVELLDAPAHRLAQVHVGSSRAVDLHESGYEAQAERPLKQVLRLALKLSQAVESHVLQVAHGAAQKDVVTLALVSQHADLPIIGQVGRAVHELSQGDTGPVIPTIAGGQLVLGGRASITHMESGLPRGSALDVLPLTQVAGDWVSQHEWDNVSSSCLNPVFTISLISPQDSGGGDKACTRMAEQYSPLYAQRVTANTLAITAAVPELLLITDLDTGITIKEVNSAIKALKNNKSPEAEGLSHQAYKAGDVIRRDPKVFSINLDNWEALASDRANWRAALKNCRRDSLEAYKSFLEERCSKREAGCQLQVRVQGNMAAARSKATRVPIYDSDGQSGPPPPFLASTPAYLRCQTRQERRSMCQARSVPVRGDGLTDGHSDVQIGSVGSQHSNLGGQHLEVCFSKKPLKKGRLARSTSPLTDSPLQRSPATGHAD
ncbi:hypothetical protein FQN60_001300 [Etheostoma spectabile]|uniref:Uncharacterized protein n=1 Tax=Etheostoma spectabile TaxID=54343 RepID=A0A5J5D639_9PERO|nr:hypothetical protein FQN60_001300 [Etheostoma spectabile]